jgi:hypothetical protein
VSHASEHSVYCARRADLGCTAEHPRNKFASIRAAEEGWFRSRAEELDYCPEHVPDWVPAWRAKQAEKKFKVKGSYSRLPAVLSCGGCGLTEHEADESPEALKALRALAFDHGERTGHRASVTTVQQLTVEPE